ncbi:His-Xaa-Ser system radical SAM maturase HxsC [Pseudoxanthomonas winnipegensis]|uniref:His-Xaa-Ser system radical SAM maturase HxsC n=1 Tax=Pseudoxanthomonas winnipegensis TaxID=2480810 RepID=A0A4Q8LYM5_9GAMM|nr:His-Xaa-Ser system radical SAM maturase HxsC [Pseudoxanthomonas winnipegensis]RZZ90287.1 His-Xaa-Ser system radical SAM maturase HxsC [Pseudoxanthomonas winnipegensis]TAA37556.1 His-Xaa-Ser system radical SAM maturase HxsC [Pseudoxanthomonas winnipegensis]
MLPLETKASITGPVSDRLLKVGGLEEIAQSRYPYERMALDARGLPDSMLSPALLELPWAALLVDRESGSLGANTIVRLEGDSHIVSAGDVIELDALRQRAAVRYRRGDKGNVLFTTERCNSFCLMCSQPPRQVQDDWRLEQLLRLIELIDESEPSLAISGGEPTLLGAGLHHLVAKCADTLPKTHLHVLSNGRLLSDTELTNRFRGAHPNVSWGVPLYGDHFDLHDYVVQSRGAFAQTIRGLYALDAAQQRIEIRVVLVRPSLERLEQIARFIIRNLPFIEHVALMGIEPTGFAKAHYEALWADPADYTDQLTRATQALACAGLHVSLYNMPLCAVPPALWPHAKKSISGWKNDYLDECGSCSAKSQCGGFFSWVTPKWTSRAVRPIKEEVACPVF